LLWQGEVEKEVCVKEVNTNKVRNRKRDGNGDGVVPDAIVNVAAPQDGLHNGAEVVVQKDDV
jgi:hypothetical protein